MSYKTFKRQQRCHVKDVLNKTHAERTAAWSGLQLTWLPGSAEHNNIVKHWQGKGPDPRKGFFFSKPELLGLSELDANTKMTELSIFQNRFYIYIYLFFNFSGETETPN